MSTQREFEAWCNVHFIAPNLKFFMVGKDKNITSYEDDDIETSWNAWQAKKLNQDIDTAHQDTIRKLTEQLESIRDLLASQEDKECLGVGYPGNVSDCAPWPIVDEVINNINITLKASKGKAND